MLADIGDFFGNRTPAQEKSRSRVVIDYMRMAKYDVVTIGEDSIGLHHSAECWDDGEEHENPDLCVDSQYMDLFEDGYPDNYQYPSTAKAAIK